MPKAMVLHPFTSTHRRNTGDGVRADATAGAGDPRGSPHRQSAEAVVEALGSDSARGLSQAEVQRRLDLHGPNRLKSAPETPWWRRLLEQFENFLVIILLVATVISMAEWLLQDPRERALPYEAIVILAIVMLNALLGYIQEARAEKSVRALMALAAPEATVVRDGERQRVATHDIVPGDIVMIEAGDKIPADARIIESANLHTDEAPLTGESMPVAKETQADRRRRRPRRSPQHAVLQHRRHLWPRPRRCRRHRDGDRGRPHRRPARSRREGADAAAAGARPHRQAPEHHHARHLRGRVRDRAARHVRVLPSTSILGLFLFAVALAVAAIPEALPAIVTVGLSLGVRRMAAANAIVRKLPAVETLGCRDRYLLRQDRHADPQRDDRARDLHGRHARRGRRQRLHPGGRLHRRRATLAEASPRTRRRGANPACCRARQRRGAHRERGRWRCRAIRPRARWSSRRASSASAEASSRAFRASRRFRSRRSASATPPFMPISKARRAARLRQGCARDPAREVPLSVGRTARSCRSTRTAAATLVRRNDALAGQALRTLAIATRTVPAAALGLDPQDVADRASSIELPDSIEDDLMLLGLVGMIDPPRAGGEGGRRRRPTARTSAP